MTESRLQMMQRVLKGRMLPLLVIFFATLLPQFLINLLSTHNYFVASFIGSPAMNFFTCVYSQGRVRMGDYLINVKPDMVAKLEKYEGKEIIVGIRPEDIFLSKDGYGINVSSNVVELLGSELIIHSEIAGTSFAWKTTSKNNIVPHQDLKIVFESHSLRFFDLETEEGIY